MSRVLSSLAIPVVCAGCVATAAPEAVITEITEQEVAGQPQCRDYTATAVVGGLPQQIAGRFCRRADGAWEMVETAPGQQTQYATYWPPYADDGWFWGPPFGFGLGTIVILNHGHFHRFAPRHHFFAGGMHHGFGHHSGGHHHG